MRGADLSTDQTSDTVDMADIVSAVWRYKLIVFVLPLAITLVAIIMLVLSPNIYRSEALVAPRMDNSSSALGSLAGQYAGLLGLSGLSLGSGSGNKTVQGLETLQSRKFLAEFIERHELLVPLFAGESWDAETGQLGLDDSVYDPSTQTWVRDVSRPRTPKPSLLEAVDVFKDSLRVREDGDTGLVTISIEHLSPVVAGEWVQLLITDLNEVIRSSDVHEAEQAISYLEGQANATPLADVKSVFYELIEEQVKTVMLANVSEEYFLKVIDPAFVPEEKIRPKRGLLALMFLVMSFLLTGLTVLGYEFLLRRPSERQRAV